MKKYRSSSIWCQLFESHLSDRMDFALTAHGDTWVETAEACSSDYFWVIAGSKQETSGGIFWYLGIPVLPE